jgi:hypothetical protein
VVNPDWDSVDVLRLHRPLDGAGLIREEASASSLFLPRGAPVWRLEASPRLQWGHYEPGGESLASGAWEREVEPLLDAGGLELAAIISQSYAIERNHTQCGQ